MKEERRFAIGVDVGGSHISSAVIDLEKFELLESSYYSQKIDNKEDKDYILKNWATVINKTFSNVPFNELSGIAFAMPGPFDYPAGIAKFEGNDKYENLFNVSVRQELKKYLEWGEDINFYNDAFCFAVGAAVNRHSEGKPAVGITLGTGFGAAFIKDGIPLMNGPGVPDNGCLWNLAYKDGLADDYFSTRWFLSEFKKRTGQEVIGVREMVESGKEANLEIFGEFAENLGGFLLPYLMKFRAEALMIGGNIARAETFFLPVLGELFKKKGLSIRIEILGETEKCNILGSTSLMTSNFWKNKRDLTSFF